MGGKCFVIVFILLSLLVFLIQMFSHRVATLNMKLFRILCNVITSGEQLSVEKNLLLSK